MKYFSVCSGIEAASVAWRPLGWEPVAFCEVDQFCSALLAQRHPDVPNLGDITALTERDVERFAGTTDVVVGGTPCQSFSVAGLRGGLGDARGNLALRFCQLVGAIRPRWFVWENVPGVLSSGGGRDFGAILGAMAELGYGFAYRILDSQYVRVESHAFAVPQVRRRVFVVGHLGSWTYAAAVLFERESLCGDTPTRREAGEGTARSVAPCLDASGYGVARAGDNRGQDPVIAVVAHTQIPERSLCLNARSTQRIDAESETLIPAFGGGFDVSHTLCAEGHDASEDGTGRGTPLVPVAETLTSQWHHSQGQKAGNNVGVMNPIAEQRGVRRLTPRECERLQGFPDDYTLIQYRGKPAADGPRYRAIGISMAVNCMRWIGDRIALAETAAAADASRANV